MNYFTKDVEIEESHLNSANQQRIASLVHSLPDEELSLSWRSQLNVKLIASLEAKQRKKKTLKFFTWGTSLSCGTAILAVVFMMPSKTPSIVAPVANNDSHGFASELVQAHQESVVLASVSGLGSSNHETSISEDIFDPQDELL